MVPRARMAFVRSPPPCPPQPKNYAYIEFVNVEDAERAILDGHNTDFKG